MTANVAAHLVKSSLAQRTGTNPLDWFLVFKARYGMQVVFRELAEQVNRGAINGLKPPNRKTVITQAFTCATAIDPVLVAGLIPDYAEIDLRTLSIDPTQLARAETPAATVIQHTFGYISSAAEQLAQTARASGALVVEDSAHCVGRMAFDSRGVPLADVSVHSFGVEKMLPTRFGGAIWVSPNMRDRELRARIAGSLAGLPSVARRLDVTARLFRNQNRVLNRLGGAAQPTRAALTALRVYEPAIAKVEQEGQLPYPPQAPSPWMTSQMVVGLAELADIEATRRLASGVYRAELPDELNFLVDVSQPLLRYPVYAESEMMAEDLIKHLIANGVYAGRWYRPPLYPGVPDMHQYNLNLNELPVTKAASDRIVNLPTNVTGNEARRIAELVRSFVTF